MGGLAPFHLAGVQRRSECKQGLPSGSTHPLREGRATPIPPRFFRGALVPFLLNVRSLSLSLLSGAAQKAMLPGWHSGAHMPLLSASLFCLHRSGSHRLVSLTYRISLLNPTGLISSPNFSIFLHKPCCLHRPFPLQLSFSWAWLVLGTLGPRATSQGKTGIIIHGTSRQ